MRSAARLATQLGVEWTAVYVETPALQRLPAPERERILRTVKLAQELGAKTAILSGEDPAALIVDYARTHNCSKVIVGRGEARRALALGAGLAAARGRRRARHRPDRNRPRRRRPSTNGPRPSAPTADADDPRRDAKRLRYVWALAACAFTTLVATALLPYFDLANIVMLFLLTVVLVALKFGRGPAVLAAFVSVAAFDFFCVPPRLSFAVSDAQYLLTFAVMLAVALIIGQMTAGLRYQARIASYREERARSLYEFARDLSSLLADRAGRRHHRAVHRADVPGRRGRAGPGRPGAGRRPQRWRRGARRRRRRRAVGVRQGAARRSWHRYPCRQRIPVPAAARADAHARRARDPSPRIAGSCWSPSSSASSTRLPRSPRSPSSACITSRWPSRC